MAELGKIGRGALLPLLLASAAAAAQGSAASSQGVAPDLAAQAAARNIENGKAPDSVGTGPWHATKLQDPSLPGFVIYRPADLAKLGAVKLPIYIFGNGACSEDGASSRQHLLQIASYGYLVIAPGGIYSGPGIAM